MAAPFGPPLTDNRAPVEQESRAPALGLELTPAERRGFDLACETLEAWGAQIARSGVSLPGARYPVTHRKMMEHGGHMVAATAAALRALA